MLGDEADRRCLERLAYTHLDDWIEQRPQGARAGQHGAEDRLAAALTLQKKLALILEGEPPHEMFVRRKPIEEQPIGWEPDPNDGVRINIRPFVEAGVLRGNPKFQWGIARGKNPTRSPWGEVRDNGPHLTGAEKRAARERVAGAGHQVAGGARTGSDSRGGRS